MKYLKLSLLYTSVILIGLLWTQNKGYYGEKQILTSIPTPMERYIGAIAYRESHGRQHVVNEFGMLGLYQFSINTLRTLGYTRSAKEFLNNKQLQDTMMVKYLTVNYSILKPYIKRYDNKTFKGVRITVAGILAAAHLGGAGSVMEWFKNDNASGLIDANGTSIRMYMVQFGGHGKILGD